jgi:hypothetical protein
METSSGDTPAVVTVDSAPTEAVVVNAPTGVESSVVVTTPALSPSPSAVELTESEKRIRQLVAQRKEEEEKRREGEKTIEYWKGVAEARSTPTPGIQNVIPPDLANVAPVAPNIDKYETFEEYEIAKETYIINKAKWEIKKDAAKEEAKRKEEEKVTKQQSEFKRIQSNWESKKVEAQVKYSDFHTVISDPNFVQTGVMQLLIQDSEVAGDLAYYLAKNPTEMARLNSLPPHHAAKAVGVLENKFITSSTPAPQNILSQAPAPITTVQPAGGVGEVDEQNLPIEEFVRRRNQKQGLIK